AELFLIVGLDSLVDLPRWRAPDRILSRAHLLVVPRPGDAAIPDSVLGKYTLLDFVENDVSSTDIRARIAAGDPCDDVLPCAVSAMIRERGLYRECAPHSARR
ncbi:MAG: nicotinate (nicotinamide) nucleotide adenylyltransferase, partial [Candidatus Hydrogenedentes bacterium]|nr:nicotinate (nicotinamide) nucleotide adenylyltransferase [Candidatus Hydrogenedentota bacterium]